MRGTGVFVTNDELGRVVGALKNPFEEGLTSYRDEVKLLYVKYGVQQEVFLNTCTGEFCFID